MKYEILLQYVCAHMMLITFIIITMFACLHHYYATIRTALHTYVVYCIVIRRILQGGGSEGDPKNAKRHSGERNIDTGDQK